MKNFLYTKFIAEFDNIPEEMKDLRAEDVDRTPAENLAYQVGWTTLVLKWEHDERNGLEVKTPSNQFKWNQLGNCMSGSWIPMLVYRSMNSERSWTQIFRGFMR